MNVRQKSAFMRRIHVGCGVILIVAFALNGVDAATPEQLQSAAEKSIGLLQRSGPQFFRQSGCVACHQQTVASMAVAEARRRGLKFDDKTAREELQITALTLKSYRARFLQRVDHPANSAPSIGYLALGLAAEEYPADETTDAMIIEMAGRQTADGSWTAFGHRPPLEYSPISATALAAQAIRLYGPPGLKRPLEQRVARARDWLASAQPRTNAEHAFRLLGLIWSGAEEKLAAEETKTLLADQRDDGGWSQLSTLQSDAYATGLTLYALHEAGGISSEHPAYQRSLEYLLKTQQDDGSWHVKSRAFPFQPYFESGFPHGHDQWISATATGFATVALMRALPASDASTEAKGRAGS